VSLVHSEAELLEFVAHQRWFGAKSEELTGAFMLDRALLREEPALADALVELHYASGHRDVYQLVLGGSECDLLADPAFAREVIVRIRESSTVPTVDGEITFASIGDAVHGAPLEQVRLMGVEQSNSSLVVDDRLFVKVYRRLEAGENPELELLRFLALHDYRNTPALAGWWSYLGPALNATMGTVQAFVPGAVDGWALAVEELGSDPEAFLARVHRLGEVIGELHAVLASDTDDPDFAPEEASQESLALLVATVDEEIDHVFLRLPDTEAVAPLIGRGDAVRHVLQSLAGVGSVGRRIRHHGDLHLGQILWSGGDWLVIDFEGEPARSLAERRGKRSPLRDVAGMIRSFTYATAVSGADREVEERARAEFLDGYLGAVEPTGLLPPPETTERLLRIFELEKAIYELRYELANRPDWAHVPVGGIQRLLEASADG
jgi:trehalose synthase-fused probable maltokinase